MYWINFTTGCLIAVLRQGQSSKVNQPILAHYFKASARIAPTVNLRVGYTQLLSAAISVAALMLGLFMASFPFNRAETVATYRWGTHEHYGRYYKGPRDIQWFWISVGSWLILGSLALGNLGLFRRALSGRILQWLGRISFALYLYHGPLLCSFGAWVVAELVKMGYTQDRAACYMLVPFWAVLLVLAHVATATIDNITIQFAAFVENLVYVPANSIKVTRD